MRAKGIVPLTGAALCWGSAAIFVRLAYSVQPATLAFYRLGVPALIAALFAGFSNQLKRLGRRSTVLLLTCGIALGLGVVCFNYAVRTTSVSNATFLVNTSPVFVAFLAPLTIGERTTRREVVSVSIALSGTLLVMFSPENVFSGSVVNLGDLVAVLAAFFGGIYTLVGREARGRIGIPLFCFMFYLFSFAMIPALGLVLISERPIAPSYHMNNVGAILGAALIPILFGHMLYSYALRAVKAVVAALFLVLTPFLASVLAFFLFLEAPSLVQIAGYLLIFIAVVNAASPPKRPVQSL